MTDFINAPFVDDSAAGLLPRRVVIHCAVMPHVDPEERRAYFRAYREKHREKLRKRVREWKRANPERTYEINAKSVRRNPGPKRAAALRYRAKDVPLANQRLRDWRARNKEHEAAYRSRPDVRERTRERRSIWRRQNARWIITSRLRKRLDAALKAAGGRKSRSIIELIGCTPAQLVQHIEAQFLKGMSWPNRAEWHIDHIRPCASFDLRDPEQQKVCFHFTNLRPLWGADNLAKADKELLLL